MLTSAHNVQSGENAMQIEKDMNQNVTNFSHCGDNYSALAFE
jgi:hypothetical protein